MSGLSNVTSLPLRPSPSSAASATITSSAEKSESEVDRVLRPIPSHGVPLIRFEESHPQVTIFVKLCKADMRCILLCSSNLG